MEKTGRAGARRLTRAVLRLMLCAAALVMSATAAEAACTVSASGVSFGAYNALSAAPLDSTGSVTLQCAGSDKNIRVSLSTGSSGTYMARTLKQGSYQLLYNVFRDAAMTTVWGDGTGGTQMLVIANWTGGPNTPQVHTIYGRIPALQNAAAGAYSDPIVVTVNF